MIDWLSEWTYVAVASVKIKRTLLAALVAPALVLAIGTYSTSDFELVGTYSQLTDPIRAAFLDRYKGIAIGLFFGFVGLALRQLPRERDRLFRL